MPWVFADSGSIEDFRGKFKSSVPVSGSTCNSAATSVSASTFCGTVQAMDSLQPSHLHSLLLCCLHQILMQNLDIQLWHHFCVGIGLITSAKHQLLASFVRSHLHRTSSSPTQKCRDLTRQHGRCCYQHGRVGQDWQQCHPWPKDLGPSGHQASGKTNSDINLSISISDEELYHMKMKGHITGDNKLKSLPRDLRTPCMHITMDTS